MAFRTRYDFRQLRDLGKDSVRAAEQLEEDLVKDVTHASIAGLVAAKAKSPLATGELTGGITARGVKVIPQAGGILVEDLISATSPHALVQEGGRAKGHGVPEGPIFRWVKLKAGQGKLDLAWTGQEGEDAIHAATYKIRSSMAARGFKGKRFMAAGAAAGRVELELRLTATEARLRATIEGV